MLLVRAIVPPKVAELVLPTVLAWAWVADLWPVRLSGRGVRYLSHIRRISLVDAGCGTKALTKATKRTVPFAFLFRSFFSFRLCLSFRCQALYLGPRGRNVGKPIGRASNNFADAVRAVPGAPHLSVAGGQLPLPACIRGHPR